MTPEKNYYTLFQFLSLLLLPFALFWNLGITAVHADEATRALISLEMIFSNDYLCPTINGEYYYNKPPLYNWILVSFIRFFGFSEFVLRLPSVLSLLGFSMSLYFFVKKNTNEKQAFYTSVGLICCARILFYDSFHGLIDLTFSWITFLSFIFLYEAFQKKQYWFLFLSTYLLMSIGFLMKGLPSLVFQAISLISFFSYHKKLRLLFSPAHWVSACISLLIVSTYYFFYFQENTDLYTYFNTLINESSKRTIFMEQGNLDPFIKDRFWNTIIYMLSFPFFLLSIMLPWGLLSFSFLRKDFFKIIRSNPFLCYSALLFAVNIIVYWLSPVTKARYLFMLFPFVLILLFHFYDISKHKVLLHKYLKVTLYLLPIFSFSPLLVPKLTLIPRANLWVMSSIFCTISLLLIYLQHKSHYQHLLMAVIIFFLSTRIFFNLTALPERLQTNYESITTRVQGKKLGQITKGKKVYRIGTKVSRSPYYLNHDISMYATWERQEIIPMKAKADNKKDMYIVTQEQLEENEFMILYDFETRYEREKTHHENKRFLVRLK